MGGPSLAEADGNKVNINPPHATSERVLVISKINTPGSIAHNAIQVKKLGSLIDSYCNRPWYSSKVAMFQLELDKS